MAVCLAATGWDRRHSAQVGERRLGAKAVRVVANGGEPLPGHLDAETDQLDQARCRLGHEHPEIRVGLFDHEGNR
jgi:hypothetical protein